MSDKVEEVAAPIESAPAPVAASAPNKEADLKESVPSSAKEDDLDDLDDLLDDFADEILSKPPGSTIGTEIETKTVDEPLNDEFKTGIEELIKDLKIEDPDTQQQFEELVKQFEVNHREEAEAEAKKPANFEYVMKETMERLKKSGETVDEKIKNDPAGGNPEDMLTQLLAGLGGAGGDGEDLDMSNLLANMLEQLSSKEVLYEPIKDLNDKFPEYLREKKDTITKAEYANYTKQYEITNDILAIFDTPGYDDDKKENRDKVNTLLESLQELGQPPTELIGDAGDFPLFGGGAPGGADGLDFGSQDLPPGMDKELEESCKQQ